MGMLAHPGMVAIDEKVVRRVFEAGFRGRGKGSAGYKNFGRRLLSSVCLLPGLNNLYLLKIRNPQCTQVYVRQESDRSLHWKYDFINISSRPNEVRIRFMKGRVPTQIKTQEQEMSTCLFGPSESVLSLDFWDFKHNGVKLH